MCQLNLEDKIKSEPQPGKDYPRKLLVKKEKLKVNYYLPNASRLVIHRTLIAEVPENVT